MSANSVKYLCRFSILLGLALSACHNEDASPSSTPTTAPITPATYSVSATVAGLNGTGLVLQNNGGGNMSVTANGSVTFSSMQASGTAYAVTVLTQPGSPDQTCTVTNSAGTIAQANVTNVTVTCTDNFVPTYAPAPKGDPQGAAITQMIDATGGSVTSADGRITLDVPAGALASATTISIQPITNTTPNGIGLGYLLEPEGTMFAAPVTLTFHLSATEALALGSTFVATQHADGFWYSQPNQQRDSSALTVSVSTTHFSAWSIAETLKLDPAKTRVKTSASAQFTATILIVDPRGDEAANPNGEELKMPESVPLGHFTIQTNTWAVNNIEEGNAQYGRIVELQEPGLYYAPATVPTPSEVTITVTIQIGRTKVTAPALADIYFQEFWTGTTNITQIDGTQTQANVTFVNKPDPSQAETELHFVVQSGVVNAKIPSTNGSGCTQSISPDHNTMGAANASFEGGDGSMTVTYSTAPGVDKADVTGGGTTAWPAILTTVCENSTLTLNTTEAAAWWPINPGQTLTATNGVLDGTVSNALGSGTIHLERQ
jgi:hypothetical protein